MSAARTSTIRWHVFTGEYPPQPGGVADYTRLLARGLAEAGDEVCVWAPSCADPALQEPGVEVRRLPDRFGPRGLRQLGRALRREPGPFRLLVQYVPHMYGYRAMNLPLCLWLRYACPARPWVMFHEVAFPVSRGQPLRHNFLGLVHRRMAALVAGAAERLFVSTPAWEPLLGRLDPGPKPVSWLPVPSNVPTEADPTAVAAVRGRLTTVPGATVVGHFGTFGPSAADLLAACLPPLLQADRRRLALLVGRRSGPFAERLRGDHPDLAEQVHATGGLGAEAVAAHLHACDVLLQPCIDGVSSRRGSVMAGLALGLPLVTTRGPATEPVWEHGLVALAPADDPRALTAAVERLLADPEACRRLGAAGRAGYQEHFTLEKTVRALRAPWPSAPAEFAPAEADRLETTRWR
jgi:glycosyltransferase involved in cell wall biosynthesis